MDDGTDPAASTVSLCTARLSRPALGLAVVVSKSSVKRTEYGWVIVLDAISVSELEGNASFADRGLEMERPNKGWREPVAPRGYGSRRPGMEKGAAWVEAVPSVDFLPAMVAALEFPIRANKVGICRRNLGGSIEYRSEQSIPPTPGTQTHEPSTQRPRPEHASLFDSEHPNRGVSQSGPPNPASQ